MNSVELAPLKLLIRGCSGLIPIAGILMCVLSEPFGETVALGRGYRSSFIKRGYELARPS